MYAQDVGFKISREERVQVTTDLGFINLKMNRVSSDKYTLENYWHGLQLSI